MKLRKQDPRITKATEEYSRLCEEYEEMTGDSLAERFFFDPLNIEDYPEELERAVQNLKDVLAGKKLIDDVSTEVSPLMIF
ncbi:hypothetical protein [Pseudolactococcus insecticola]|uniref:Uncharacterized protein n=1 Tax=Pseudolactococcus insecticola TaxID=2709158 RepID=A0A6A0B7L4_9LACT|nr:hypothetical protein [Lactococcus insecticola]GFH39777.1 hypothetical protein Hs20B_01750 [Lactococcus insecticola]